MSRTLCLIIAQPMASILFETYLFALTPAKSVVCYYFCLVSRQLNHLETGVVNFVSEMCFALTHRQTFHHSGNYTVCVSAFMSGNGTYRPPTTKSRAPKSPQNIYATAGQPLTNRAATSHPQTTRSASALLKSNCPAKRRGRSVTKRKLRNVCVCLCDASPPF